MKLIKVNVLKEWVENWFTKNRLYHPYAKNNNIPITELYDILEQMPSAQPEQKWIPVSERLPEKKTEVIYSLENHYVSTGYMTDRDYEGNIVELHWEDIESGVLIYPEAWMPLPEPYKEGEDDQRRSNN